MAFNQTQFELDKIGNNINNLVIDEPHSLANRPTRSIAPNFGPFFGDSVVIHDGSTVLTRGIDYQIVELHQEATLRYGKEIASVILVINPSVSSNVEVTYQALGGHYTYSDEAIANIYQTVISDNRPVDWSNVFNKPTEFSPTIHRHLLDDVYGFEPIVDLLERIKRSISLGQTQVVLEIVNALMSRFSYEELPKVLPNNKLIQYDALLFFLSRRKILNNIWVDVKEPIWYKGTSVAVQVDTSGYPPNTTLHWELYKPNLSIGLFTSTKGSFQTNGGIFEFNIYVPSDPTLVENPIYVGIKEQPSDIDFKAVTYTLNIQEYASTSSAYGLLLFGQQDFGPYDLFAGELDLNDERRLYHQLTNY